MGLAEVLLVNAEEMRKATEPELLALGPAIRDARAEVLTWLKHVPAGARGLEVMRKRGLAVQLHKMTENVQRALGGAMKADLGHGLPRAEKAALRGAERLVAAATQAPVRLSEARVLARTKGLLLDRIERSASRYGSDVAQDIRSRLLTGLLAGDSREQLVSRMLQNTGLIRLYEKEGLDRFSGHGVDRLAEMYRNDADRMVVTELAHAHNRAAEESVVELNRDDPGYLMRVNGVLDRRICRLCRRLDGKTAEPGQLFMGRYRIPPFHPRCRCLLDPWRSDWTL